MDLTLVWGDAHARRTMARACGSQSEMDGEDTKRAGHAPSPFSRTLAQIGEAPARYTDPPPLFFFP